MYKHFPVIIILLCVLWKLMVFLILRPIQLLAYKRAIIYELIIFLPITTVSMNTRKHSVKMAWKWKLDMRCIHLLTLKIGIAWVSIFVPKKHVWKDCASIHFPFYSLSNESKANLEFLFVNTSSNSFSKLLQNNQISENTQRMEIGVLEETEVD